MCIPAVNHHFSSINKAIFLYFSLGVFNSARAAAKYACFIILELTLGSFTTFTFVGSGSTVKQKEAS